MDTITVEYNVVSVTKPEMSTVVIRHYTDEPASIHNIFHDWLYLYLKCLETGIGFVGIVIKNDSGSYPNFIMMKLRNVLMQLLEKADGDIPLTALQKKLLKDTLRGIKFDKS